MIPLRIFIGMDSRQPISYNVLQYSIVKNASVPVSITPLCFKTLPIERVGLTEFTYSRYLVPWLCDYKGEALFLDADMVVDADIAELFEARQSTCSVTVCNTKEAFERPSAMLFTNDLCEKLTPEYIASGTPQDFREWTSSSGEIGIFPNRWNYCVGYDHEDISPKLIHYTAGIPIWSETKNSRFADVWHKYHKEMNASVGYDELMARSKHHQRVLSGEINR